MNEQIIESPIDGILQEDLISIAESDLPLTTLAGSTILVTGATGLIGSIFIKSLLCCNRLKNTDIKIKALARSEKKAKSVFGRLLNLDNLEMIYGDITEEIVVDGKVDYIIHGASVTNSKMMVTEPVNTIKTTMDGTYSILKLADEKKVKGMVYLSSMEAYGSPDPSLEKVTEKDLGYIDCLNVRSCYSEGKRMAECLCACYAHQYGVPVKIARLAQTFGAGVSYNETRVFAQFARSFIEGKNIVLHTKGESTGNYCYTADCIRALIYILISGEAGEAYTVVNPETTITIGDMACMISDMSGGRIKTVFDIPEDALQYGYAPTVKMHLSADKLMSLGWKPTYDLPQMYKRLINSMKISKE